MDERSKKIVKDHIIKIHLLLKDENMCRGCLFEMYCRPDCETNCTESGCKRVKECDPNKGFPVSEPTEFLNLCRFTKEFVKRF